MATIGKKIMLYLCPNSLGYCVLSLILFEDLENCKFLERFGCTVSKIQ